MKKLSHIQKSEPKVYPLFLLTAVVFVITIMVVFVPTITVLGQENETLQSVNEKISKFDGLGLIESDVQTVVGQAIKTLIGIVGTIALAVFVWGGFSWMTAGGESAKVQKAKDVLKWAVLGLVIIFGSYVIVSFVLRALL